MTPEELSVAYVELKRYSHEQDSTIQKLRIMNRELIDSASRQEALLDAVLFKIKALEKKL